VPLAAVERQLEFLVEDAFVRGVHVDDHQALAVLRQDIDAVQLRQRVAEWRAAGLRAMRRRLRRAGAAAAAGCVPTKAR
jgi:hypothetical protein